MWDGIQKVFGCFSVGFKSTSGGKTTYYKLKPPDVVVVLLRSLGDWISYADIVRQLGLSSGHYRVRAFRRGRPGLLMSWLLNLCKLGLLEMKREGKKIFFRLDLRTASILLILLKDFERSSTMWSG